MKKLASGLSEASSTAPSDGKVAFTAEEARARGIIINDEPPAPASCEYCGNCLPYEGYAVLGFIVHWKESPVRCTCKMAQKYWREWDARKAEEDAREAERKAEKQRQAIFEYRLKQSRMSRRQHSCTFDSFIKNSANAYAYEAATAYSENFAVHLKTGLGLFIAGTCGSGKTHLASAIALELMHSGYKVIMEPSVDILAAIKRGYDSRSGATEDEEIRPYLQAELLIIDDLGKEQCTPWAASTLYRIINYRYSNMLPTIVTTNYNDEQLIARLTPKGDDRSAANAIMSRLYESAIGISLCDKDMRQA